MWETFVLWAFCAPPAIRMLFLWIIISARLATVSELSSPFRASLVQCDVSRLLPLQGERNKRSLIQYNRAELLAVPPARLTPDLTSKLRLLQLGVNLPRKRYPRKNKQLKRGGLKLWHLNAQSCRQIDSDIHDLIIENEIDILMLSETWLYKAGDEKHSAAMKPHGYDFYPFPRPSGLAGGGIAVIVRKCLKKCITFNELDFTSFDAVEMKVSADHVSASCVCLYRTPKLSKAAFMEEFPDLLSMFSDSHRDFSILGDFNFHFDNSGDSYVKRLKTLLSDHNLLQLVSVGTQRCGHTLDWAVVRSEGSLLSLDSVLECPGLSDHKALVCTLSMSKPQPETRTVTSRNLKAVFLPAFQNDVKAVMEGTDRHSGNLDLNNLVGTFNEGLRQILDRHAPEVTRRVRDRPSAPWLTDEVREARRRRRRAEKRWRRKRLEVYRDIYVRERRATRSVIQKAKEQFFCAKIESSPSCRQLFKVSAELLGKEKSTPLPSNIPHAELPQQFSDFFSSKISRIREELDTRVHDPPTFAVHNGHVFDHFEPVSQKDIKEIILAMPTKSCILDPIPTTLLKQCLPDLLPLVTDIVNVSLSSGLVPSYFKQALVCPLLKKHGLDPNDLKNFRPVSNLPFLSKVLERVVLQQLQKHLLENDLIEVHQSAYRKGHSTETAVLSVLNGLLVNADNRLVSLMALLDLSAAFDTLDHSILLRRLELTFGVRGTVLCWFNSYVQDRFQSVIVDGVLSAPSPLVYGVPQGSVLGPVLFTLYSQPLSDVIVQHDCQFHKYADDTELSKSVKPESFCDVRSDIQSCIGDVQLWMNNNYLKLNPDKTELMTVGSPARLGLVGSDPLCIDGSDIELGTSVKYLGVKIDQTLSMNDQIGSICRASFLELRRIASIRKYLSTGAAARLVMAMITSRLDYCNSILAGLTAEQISRLQRVQNNAARLVLRKKKSDHVTPLLKELHWLPVSFRCQFKICTLAFRHFDGSLPPYLSNVLTTYEPSRNLRSSEEKLLKPPRCNFKSAGERSFSYIAPYLWNSLPSGLRNVDTLPTFKSELKTYFCKQAFS